MWAISLARVWWTSRNEILTSAPITYEPFNNIIVASFSFAEHVDSTGFGRYGCAEFASNRHFEGQYIGCDSISGSHLIGSDTHFFSHFIDESVEVLFQARLSDWHWEYRIDDCRPVAAWLQVCWVRLKRWNQANWIEWLKPLRYDWFHSPGKCKRRHWGLARSMRSAAWSSTKSAD